MRLKVVLTDWAIDDVLKDFPSECNADFISGDRIVELYCQLKISRGYCPSAFLEITNFLLNKFIYHTKDIK
jgi:hypothetical protein